MVSRIHALRYITAEDLAHAFISDPKQILIVDGGKILGSINITLDDLTENPKTWEDLRARLSAYKMLVFHCYYSQSRAPTAAKWVIERMGGRVLSPDPRGSPSSASSAAGTDGSTNEELPIDVRVLQGGWWQWNEKYYGHPQLFETIHPAPKSSTATTSQSSTQLSKN